MNLKKPLSGNFFPLVLICLFTSLTSCEKESPRAREYPRLTATQVINVTDTGAIFSADLYSLGSEPLYNYGFVWGFNQEPDINGNRIFIGSPSCTGIFKAEVTTALSKDQDYYVKSFVQTSKRIVYGPAAKFKSLGSKGPVIYQFYPDSAAWGDTIHIAGNNFSWVFSQNEVYLNDVSCRTIQSSPTILNCIVDSKVLSKTNTVSVRLAGSANTYTQKQFKVRFPEIAGISNENIFWRDTLSVTLRNFSFDVFPYLETSAFIGLNQCQIISKSKNFLKIIIPDNVKTVENDLKVRINGLNLVWPGKLKLESPAITSFKPAEATWGQKLSIKGRFHPDKIKNTFKLGASTATITDFCTDSAKILIPVSIGNRKNLLSLSCSPFNITATDTFKLFSPVMTSVSPLSGPSATTVSIRGKYFSGGQYNFTKVKFGDILVSPSVVSDSVVKFSVPSGIPSGSYKIELIAGSQIATYSGDFLVMNPVIKNFYPTSATFDQPVTIEGENFLPSGIQSPTVRFGNLTASIISVNDSVIIVKVPLTIDSIPTKLGVYTNSYAYTLSGNTFTLAPPEIYSVSVSEITRGQDIIITGNNFNPTASYNTVKWAGFSFTTKSATKNQIIATVPLTEMARGNSGIEIRIGGYKRFSSSTLIYKSPWSAIRISTSFSWSTGYYDNQNGIGFALNGKGYLIDYASGRMSSFDPVSLTFTNIGIQSLFANKAGYAKVVQNDTCYLFGVNGNYRFNSNNNTFTQLSSTGSSGANGIAFSLNNKVYYGLLSSTFSGITNRNLYEYDIKTNTWSLKSTFNLPTSSYPVSYFSFNNKGYVLFKDMTFYEYDPLSNSWIKKTNHPYTGNVYGLATLVFGNKIYVGTGAGSGIAYDRFYEYDPVSNSWIQSVTYPNGPAYNTVSFIINNKAYVGFGNVAYRRDFYEFDPTYPLY